MEIKDLDKFLELIKEIYYVETPEDFLELNLDKDTIHKDVLELIEFKPKTTTEIREFIGIDRFTAEERLIKMFPEKDMNKINRLLNDYDMFKKAQNKVPKIFNLDEITDEDIKQTILYEYPVYKIVKNEVIIITGGSNVGKSYHVAFILSRMNKDIKKFYLCPDQGIHQCASMLKARKVRNIEITENEDLNLSLLAYEKRNGYYPDIVVIDMISSLKVSGKNELEMEHNRVKALKEFKKKFPTVTFIYIAEERKKGNSDFNKHPTLDSLKGNNGLAYKADLVINLYWVEKSLHIINLKGRLDNAKTKDIVFRLGVNEPHRNIWAVAKKPEERIDV